jgi:hypothetical protein
MDLKRIAVLLVLPVALAACDSGQPTYSASNANSAPPPPPAQAEEQAPPPVVAQAPVEAPRPPPTAPVRQDSPKPSRALQDSATRFAQVPPGKMGVVPKLGVGSCDDYIERYRTCFNNTQITQEDKRPLRRALAQQVRQWKAAAADGKLSQVAMECTEADRKARVEFSKVGCKTF